MVGNVPNLMKTINPQIQEAQQITSRRNKGKKNKPRSIIMKMHKISDKNLESSQVFFLKPHYIQRNKD